MSKASKNFQRQIVILSILFASILICTSIIIFNYSSIKDSSQREELPFTKRDYTVLITGSSEDKNFLKQVYEGSSIVSNFYDCAIQYYEPEIKNNDRNLQTLLDYAGFINADCVITYLDNPVENIILPKNRDGKKIPLITVGRYSYDFPTLTHIGVNYAELGVSLAEEAINYLYGRGTVYILNISEGNDFYNSTTINNMYNRLKSENEIRIINNVAEKNPEFSIEDDIRQQIASSGKIDLILTTSEKGSILAVQTLSDLNLNSKTKIIGFGDGFESQNYFDKGLITALFSTNAVDIGKKAVQEFFEFRTNGSANNYVTAEIKIQRQGR